MQWIGLVQNPYMRKKSVRYFQKTGLRSAANRIIRKWPMLPVAGPTKAKKSEGVIQDGTASTPSVTPASSISGRTSEAFLSNSSSPGRFPASRKMWTVPSGRLVVPDLLRELGTNVASTGPIQKDISFCDSTKFHKQFWIAPLPPSFFFPALAYGRLPASSFFSKSIQSICNGPFL